jgi:hypothetical protein
MVAERVRVSRRSDLVPIELFFARCTSGVESWAHPPSRTSSSRRRGGYRNAESAGPWTQNASVLAQMHDLLT